VCGVSATSTQRWASSLLRQLMRLVTDDNTLTLSQASTLELFNI